MQPIGIEYRHKPFFEVDSSQWRPENVEENYYSIIIILEDHQRVERRMSKAQWALIWKRKF